MVNGVLPMEVMLLCEELIRKDFMKCQSIVKPKDLSWDEDVFAESLIVAFPVDL